MNQRTTPMSAVFTGRVRHRRFAQKHHSFTYPLYMLALDLDELASGATSAGIFGSEWYRPVRLVEKDYLPGDPAPLKNRILNKVRSLGGNGQIERVIMLVQARCFGLYFSPVNFYFCYSSEGLCIYMLAEVSNTPWNERHYYLVDLPISAKTEKVFHVSPFMDLDMSYHWRIKPPSELGSGLVVHIENRSTGPSEEKLFDATLTLNKEALSAESLRRVWLRQPLMTFSIVRGIYYQAVRLFMKRIRFVPYQSGAAGQTGKSG